MMNPVYILSSSAISPQHSFEPLAFLKEINTTDDGKLFVIDPDYREFINPVAIRRMSRQMKMGISTAMRALQLAGIAKPDAIITGTGLGSMTDMEHFLKDMISMEEQALNPTYFIQSTYNSVNGWISLQTKSTGYNQTYVHRGLSLELCLLDAQLLLNEHTEEMNVLAGCFDELTPDYFIVKGKCDYWKKELPNSRELLQHNTTPGTIAGEGTAFFTLSNRADGATCILRDVKLIYQAAITPVLTGINDILKQNNLSAKDIDLVIAGMNGDKNYQTLYDEVIKALDQETAVAAYKHLTGEYPTATGFGLWLATQIIQTQDFPEAVTYKRETTKPIKNILIINHYILNSASLILISSMS